MHLTRALLLPVALLFAAFAAPPALGAVLEVGGASGDTASDGQATPEGSEHTYFVGESGAWVHSSCDSLVPNELSVGVFSDLRNAGKPFDELTPHHIPSTKFLREAMGFGDTSKGIAINMWQVNNRVGRHPLTRTFAGKNNAAALLLETPRQALARDIVDVRKIYREAGLYGPEVRQALQEVISRNKTLHYDAFRRAR